MTADLKRPSTSPGSALAAALRRLADAVEEQPDADWPAAHAKVYFDAAVQTLYGLTGGSETDDDGELNSPRDRAIRAINDFDRARAVRRTGLFPLAVITDGDIPDGASARLRTRPALRGWWLLRKLIVPADDGHNWWIESLQIGDLAIPLGRDREPVSARAFGEDQQASMAHIPAVRESGLIGVNVRRVDGAGPGTFRAMMTGYSLTLEDARARVDDGERAAEESSQCERDAEELALQARYSLSGYRDDLVRILEAERRE